jgi:hypothetical protein
MRLRSVRLRLNRERRSAVTCTPKGAKEFREHQYGEGMITGEFFGFGLQAFEVSVAAGAMAMMLT